VQANKDRRWASKHFLSHRALQHVHSVREQLSTLLQKIGVDVTISCWPQREPFLKCLLAGMFLNIAQRVTSHDGTNKSGAGGQKMTKHEYEQQKMAQMQANTQAMNSSSSITAAGQGRFHFSNPADSTARDKWSGNIFSSKAAADAAADAAPYRTVRGHQPVHIHPSSVLFSMVSSRKLPEFVVYAELLITSKQYMRNVSVVDGAWLQELFPANFKTVDAGQRPAR
jgi:hypothetical protein